MNADMIRTRGEGGGDSTSVECFAHTSLHCARKLARSCVTSSPSSNLTVMGYGPSATPATTPVYHFTSLKRFRTRVPTVGAFPTAHPVPASSARDPLPTAEAPVGEKRRVRPPGVAGVAGVVVAVVVGSPPSPLEASTTLSYSFGLGGAANCL